MIAKRSPSGLVHSTLWVYGWKNKENISNEFPKIQLTYPSGWGETSVDWTKLMKEPALAEHIGEWSGFKSLKAKWKVQSLKMRRKSFQPYIVCKGWDPGAELLAVTLTICPHQCDVETMESAAMSSISSVDGYWVVHHVFLENRWNLTEKQPRTNINLRRNYGLHQYKPVCSTDNSYLPQLDQDDFLKSCLSWYKTRWWISLFILSVTVGVDWLKQSYWPIVTNKNVNWNTPEMYT